jgi:hypothetical protein
LVAVDGADCPIILGADRIMKSANAQRRDDPRQWFPVAGAAKLAASLRPAPARQGFDEVAYADGRVTRPLPAASEVLATRLGDRLRDPAWPGFSPFAEEEAGERGRAFWIDHSAVDPKVRSVDEVRDKIVVLASASDVGNRMDAEVVPGLGQMPGGFYHAAAIGTRLGHPLYSFASPGAEYGALFLANCFFGLIALGLTLLVAKIKRLEHHTPNVAFIEFWMETASSFVAAVFFIWLAGAVVETRLLLPGISAVLVVRILEPAFSLIRFRKLVARWKEPGQ